MQLCSIIKCGKVYYGKKNLSKAFGEQEYDKVAYISCDKNSILQEVFGVDYDMKRIIRALSALTNVDIQPGNTLLILDEVQSAPRALASLKYFCEDALDYHVAVGGSLLGIALHNDESFLVGKVDMICVFPMNFEEFILALDKKQMYDVLRSKDYAVLNTLSDALIDLLRQYYYVGGMPAVAQTYVRDEGLQKVRALKKGARANEFAVAIQWLIDTGLIHKVNRCKQPALPLKMYEDISAFKLFIVDCGLLGAMVDAPASQILIEDSIFKEYKGAFTEQYVLQQMVSRIPE